MRASTKYSPEVRERAVRLVLDQQSEHDSQRSAITSVASKIGVSPPRHGRHIGQVRHPQRIRAADLELPIHPVIRALALHRRARGLRPPAPHRALQPHPAHQPHPPMGLGGRRAARHRHPLPAKLAPDLAHPVHLEVLGVHPANLPAQPPIATHPRRLGFTCLVLVVRRWGNRHLRTDRPDPVSTTIFVDERHHPLARRSCSAWGKYADALRRISFARRSSRFSRSSSLSQRRSSLVSPARTPRPRPAWRTHLRSVSAVYPSFDTAEVIAGHCESCSP